MNHYEGYYSVKAHKIVPMENDAHKNMVMENHYYKTLEKAEAHANQADVDFAEIYLDGKLIKKVGKPPEIPNHEVESKESTPAPAEPVDAVIVDADPAIEQ